MAGDWIKMRIHLDSSPRVLQMADALELPVLHVVGMLWKVWAWADVHSLDGNALTVTDVTLDRFVDRTGFADALRKVGWLEGRDGALTFPRFAEHNGQTAKKRAETQERVARHRNANRVTDVTPKALPEKRREEKKISTPDGVDERAPPKRFVPPSLEEVEAYCQERGNRVSAQRWLDHYSSNGWKVGRNSMKDWRASVRTWEKNDVGTHGSSSVTDGIDEFFDAQRQPETPRSGIRTLPLG